MGGPLRYVCIAYWFMLLIMVVDISAKQAASIPLEMEALLRLRSEIEEDRSQILSSWTTDSPSPCKWTGIECDPGGAVQSIHLPNLNLGGALSFSPWLPHLSSLQVLDLSGNRFTGAALATILPGACGALVVLNLAGNHLSGDLPQTMLSYCSGLRSLNLSNNAISGDIPPAFLSSGCSELQVLDLSANQISGNLTGFDLGFCPSILHLDLASNLIAGLLPSSLRSNGCSQSTCLSPLLSLDLSSNRLFGLMPDGFFDGLKHLVHVDLSSNNFSGQLPASIQSCTNMTFLNLTGNLFSSSVPAFLANLTKITQLHIANNHLAGSLPDTLMRAICGTLADLDLSGNNLNGQIPASMSSCTRLRALSLSSNDFSGSFPSDIVSALQSLEVLRLAFNNLSGSISSGAINCSKLKILDVSANFLTGRIPEDMCSPLQECVLEQLILANNEFSGAIPISLANCRHLTILDLSFNMLSGNIPSELSYLPNLQRISLWYNELSGIIPRELGNLTMLRSLILNNNLLTGEVPAELSGCTYLEWLNLNNNLLAGVIPPDLGQLQKLTLLQLGNNTLIGTIPPQLGNCSQLLWVDFNTNLLQGSIPPALGRHSTAPLNTQVLFGNQLAYIRNSMSSCKGFGMGIMLDYTGITKQALYATPFTSACEESGAKPIIYVGGSLYDNPENRTIQYLDLSFNNLSGNIPEEIGLWVSLISLALSHNRLSGKLPASFANLHVLGVMDISFNELEGSLAVLSGCTLLVALNVSSNLFSGEIPGGQVSTNPASSFGNNGGLCGLPLPPCGSGGAVSPAISARPSPCSRGSSSCHEDAERLRLLSMVKTILLSLLLAFVLVCAVLIWVGMAVKSKNQQDLALTSSLNQSSSGYTGGGGTSSSWNMSGEKEPLSINVATFERPLRKLTFSQLIEATNGFSKESLIGRGGFGEVYRAELGDGSVVAIKKLIHYSFQGCREFTAEMETLGKIKHRNLVPLLGYCKVGDERLLIYEYMQGGSLEDVLHGGTREARERLTWKVRKQIAMGAAKGLAFLHHKCIPHIIHRDVKSSNVLLDKNLEPRVSDFGMARLISALDTHLSVSTLAGTPGYVPPEYYQSFRCTTKGDIYSFGVVILELLTGQRPTHKEEFGDNNLVGWVRQHVGANNFQRVLDPTIRDTLKVEHEMIQYLRIAYDCLDELPSRRPTMFQVVRMLREVACDDQQSSSSTST
ncbi:hypothetical protein KP509_15G059000 [Ceratopteris richardii]|uniref:non-specific serine/threonine protein kinase n=1 Tax=Ceratopteris richardii TaxID=49495 RepID=A0A8T2T5K4_CERRI|nr:hypothetical protein KP509_15G059000 [Ceratopteris richardii]